MLNRVENTTFFVIFLLFFCCCFCFPTSPAVLLLYEMATILCVSMFICIYPYAIREHVGIGGVAPHTLAYKSVTKGTEQNRTEQNKTTLPVIVFPHFSFPFPLSLESDIFCCIFLIAKIHKLKLKN